MARNRVRTFVRLQDAALPKAAGWDSDQLIRSKSVVRADRAQLLTGFPNPDLFDRLARSGHRLLTVPLAPSLSVRHGLHVATASSGSL